MYVVTLLRGASIDPHTSSIYAGLCALEAAGRIRLEIGNIVLPKLTGERPFYRFFYWIEAKEDGREEAVRICFDMLDWAGFPYVQLLELCDVYFKRSFREDELQKLPQSLRQKVLPYGLNYACSGPYQRLQGALTMHSNEFCQSGWKRKGQIFWKLLKHHVPILSGGKGYGDVLYGLPSYLEFENARIGVEQPKILFMTRPWDPKEQEWLDPDGMKTLNDNRASLVRALRKRFGSDVIAGFADSKYARDNYSDCILSFPTDKRAYMRLMHESAVCVQTIGIYESTGWKLAEYLAAGKCVVTEPVLDELPRRLEEKKHIATFETVEMCIEECGKLVDSVEYRIHMQRENFLYYLTEIEPTIRMYKCLATAFVESSELIRNVSGSQAMGWTPP